MIYLTNVTKKYGEKIALNEITLTLPDTGLILLKGENGSGKTTLANLIGALDFPTSGTIKVNDVELTDKNEKTLYKYREEKVGFIFQDYNLFENMTVDENLALVERSGEREKIKKFLKIDDLSDERTKNLSGGEKQRVAIARAILKNSEIIIADEPTASIDYESKKIILNFLKLLSEKKLVILITHDLESLPNVDVEITLEKGGIIECKENAVSHNLCTEKSYRNCFNPLSFAFKNFFTNKKKLILSTLLLAISIACMTIGLTELTTSLNDIAYDATVKEADSLVYFSNKMGYNGELLEEDLVSLYQNAYLKDDLYMGYALLNDGKKLEFTSGNEAPMGYNNYFEPHYNLSPIVLEIEALNKVDFGRMPREANEIIVSSYFAERFIEFGIMDVSGNIYKPNNYEELLADKKELLLGNKGVIISGIFDLKLEEYVDLKKDYEPSNKSSIFYNIIENEGRFIYVKKEFFELLRDSLPTLKENVIPMAKEPSLDDSSESFVYLKLTRDENVVAKNEIIVNTKLLKQYNIALEEAIGSTITIHFINRMSPEKSENVSFTIKAISNDRNNHINISSLEKSLKNTSVPTVVLVKKPSKKTLKSLFSSFKLKDSSLTLNTRYTSALVNYESLFVLISVLFIIPAIIFMIIAAIYLKNYLLNSVNLHKKEIALLKSLGIKDSLILNAFLVETLSLAVVAYVLSLVLSSVVNFILKRTLSKYLYIKINLITLNPFILLVILIFIIGETYLTTLLIRKKIKNESPMTILKEVDL